MQMSTLLLFALLTWTGVRPQTVQAGAYIVRQGEIEISRERYWYLGSRLVDTLDLAARDLRLASEMMLAEDGTPLEYRAEVLTLSAGTRVQRSNVEFGDSIVTWAVDGTTTETTSLAPPYGMMQNPAFAHLAVALLRLDRLSRDNQVLNMWRPEQGLVAGLEVVYSAETEGTARLAGIEMEFTTDASGWLKRLSIPAQGIIVEWYAELDESPSEKGRSPADSREPSER